MDFVSPILDIFSRLWTCTKRHVRYIYQLEKNLTTLTTEKEKLREQTNDVRRRVEIEEGQHKRCRDQVGGWLRRADALELKLDLILRQGEHEVQRKCLCNLCPKNCLSSYRIGRAVSEMLQTVSDLKREGDFGDVADMLPPPPVDERPLDTTVGLDSTFDEAWSCIQDEKVGIIGIYGMGGVGKTTLMTKINNEIGKSSEDFDVVIWAVVSRDVNMERVQDKIGKKLLFPDDLWSRFDQDEKTTEIFRVLSTKRFVLLLDDIWSRFDLLQAGVPIPNENNKAKVVFTTRDEHVCGLMGAQKKIKVECLPWIKAWKLFQSKVGEEILNSHPDIPNLAQIVAEECAGLPLGLVTVGRAMASRRTPQDWHYAITALKKPASNFAGMGDQVFKLLKFSYDSLPDKTIRSCFLYFALYPEDWLLDVANMTNCWIGEGFLDECDNLSEASALGYEIVDRLKLACLLESGEHLADSYLKMHDMIRDTALWIVSENGTKKGKFLVQADLKLTEAPPLSKWEVAERISLMHNSIEELIGAPKCPHLLTLNLQFNAFKKISDSFFAFMPSLRKLDISWNKSLTEFPVSISELCSLQHLDLSYTGIREFPIEFQKLTKLKFLYVNNMDDLHTIPRHVLSSLLMLRRVDLFHSGISDQYVEGNIFSRGNEELLDELECLNHLEVVSFTVKSEGALQKYLSSPKLQKCTYGLDIELCRGSTLLQLSSLQNNGCLSWFQINSCEDLEELEINWFQIDSCEDLEELEINWRREERQSLQNFRITRNMCFVGLRDLIIKNCKMLKELTWLISVPNLRSLKIFKCESLKEVISNEDGRIAAMGTYLDVFSHLQTLYLDELPQLKNIYSHALPFPSLNQVHVFGCPKLMKIPFDSNSAKNELNMIVGQKAWWDGLKWEDEAVKSTLLPYFLCREAPIEMMSSN